MRLVLGIFEPPKKNQENTRTALRFCAGAILDPKGKTTLRGAIFFFVSFFFRIFHAVISILFAGKVKKPL